MRILLIHNYYGTSAPSGENKVFEAEKAMLEKHGHDVAVYTRHSDEIRNGNVIARLWGKIKGALCTIGNPFAARAVAKLCREFKPDVVHFHNTFPLISPLAVRAASKYAPVVMTLHNYRMVCAAGVPTRGGKVCSLCIDKRCVWDSMKHRCYRGGLLATLPLAINITLYRKRLPRWVSRFIVLSEFQRRKMVDVGLPEDKIAVKGNFISRVERVERAEKKNQIVYIGRLSPEKGVPTLLRAWRKIGNETGCKLVLIGDGDFRKEYEKSAEGLPIEFFGQMNHDRVLELMAESLCAVQPSACWETFGLSTVEAMSVGTPSVVANVGGLPDVVQNGRFGEVFESGNPESCAAAIMRLLTRADYEEICKAAPREVRAKYSEEANYRELMKAYENKYAE